LILTDIAQVIYAPRKAFRKIVENPKYLGAILILVMFIAIQVGFSFAQFSKTQLETTYPLAGAMQTFNNSTSWVGASNVNFTNNFDDYFNNTVFIANSRLSPLDPLAYYSLFGNFSMQIQAQDSRTITAALFNISNVDASPSGFQNLSLAIQLVNPQAAPQNTTLTLYSVSEENFYTYDLTSAIADANAIGQWGNITVPLGPNAQGWIESGVPQWQNITSLSLTFTYLTDTDITILIGALFFRGMYASPLEFDISGLLFQFLQPYVLQFLFTWMIGAALVYALCRFAFKSPALWKQIFIAFGFALSVMVIRGAINLIAAATLPVNYYNYDVSFGTFFDPFITLYYPQEALTALSVQAQANVAAITASTAVFRNIVIAAFAIAYVWLGVLTTISVKTLKPEFSTSKCALIAAVSVSVTLLALWLLIGVV